MKTKELFSHQLSEAMQKKIRVAGGNDTTRVMVFSDPSVVALKEVKVYDKDNDDYTYVKRMRCASAAAFQATRHFRRRVWFKGDFKRRKLAFCADI